MVGQPPVSLLFRSQRVATTTADLIPARAVVSGGAAGVTGPAAMRHSAVWAASRLRADLVSSLPVDVYRPSPAAYGVLVEVAKPAILVTPGGPDQLWPEWCFSSQMDLDRYGNTVGIIEERDGAGRPSRIRLCAMPDVTIRSVKGELRYRVKGTEYSRDEVWHERQYTVAGSPVGLSPIAHAALSVSQGISAQEFAIRWYTGNAMPDGVLRHTSSQITPKVATDAKLLFTESMRDGGVFVTGKDWEYNPVQAQSNDHAYLDAMGASTADVARFMGVPSDLIDSPTQGSSVTYANVTQRNLQLLVMHLGPAVNRRENAFSARLVATPRRVKLNTKALLRLDPQSQAVVVGQQIADGRLTTDEARALDDNPPLSDEQIARQAQIAAALKTTQKPSPEVGKP